MLALALLFIASPVADRPGSNADLQQRYQRWERRLRSRIARHLWLPQEADRYRLADVTVRFSIDPNGRPGNVTVLHSSGLLLYDRAAVEAVRNLGRIGPVPMLAGTNRHVQIKLSYGEKTTAAADRSLTAQLEREGAASHRRTLSIITETPATEVVTSGKPSLQP